jgi:large subunit ribosomal protein L18
MAFSKEKNRGRIRKRVRAKISGTTERPRLSVFRSNTQMYAQVIDDVTGKTIASAGSAKQTSLQKVAKIEQAKGVGKLIAEAAKKAGVKKVVFDRSGYLYHGRVKALADAARENGLEF